MLLSNSFRIIICDDQPLELSNNAKLVCQILEEERITPVLSCCENEKTLWELLRSGQCFDLLLLDVLLEETNGIELARQIRQENISIPIIFASVNREMALYGYEVSALRYLSKPLDQEALREALLYCYRQIRKERELLIPVHNGTQKVFPKEILYIETQGRGCRLLLENGSLSTRLKISELEELLCRQFIRCHQSFLVNPQAIRCLHTKELELLNGTFIPVSKHRLRQVREQFFCHLKD